MLAAYRTIADTVATEIEVKRSRFLCTLQRVASEEQARDLVGGCRREYFDARHHCSAYVVRAAHSESDAQAAPDRSMPALIVRSSDDGEPAGTAGAPMLDVLRGAELQNVVAVVTRWFGGVLLGTGGLARAYGGVVQAAVAQAEHICCEPRIEMAVDLPHADAGRIESALHHAGVPVVGREYGAQVRLKVAVADDAGFEALLSRLSAGSARARRVGHRWVDVPVPVD